MSLNLKQLIKRAKRYVEPEDNTTVKEQLGIERMRAFVYYFAQKRVQFGKIIPRLTQMCRHIYGLCFKAAAAWFFRIVVLWRKLRMAFARIAITVSGLVASAGILCLPEVSKVVDDFEPLEGILSQLGATFGTILALVLTLSIIPIQRAGEAWSPSIIRLYRQDRATHVSFVTLGMFLYIAICFGRIASKNGRNPILWGILSVISPINLIILGNWAFSGKKQKRPTKAVAKKKAKR